MVDEGLFREDLMFRINTFEIRLPALRDRVADIPALACHLYRRFRPTQRPDSALFTKEALEVLQSHLWPGNVRELANVIEHATILCDEPPIAAESLPQRFLSRKLRAGKTRQAPQTLAAIESQAIQESLDRHAGNKPAAAEELGISLKTLYNKLTVLSALDKSA
jgi:two-component system NtrC family response regulator